MQIKSRSFISYSLILFLIISGIWFSLLQPDSLSADIRKDASDMHFFGFSYISVNNISPYTQLHIDFWDGKRPVRNFCTTEMLGIQDAFHMVRYMEYSGSQKEILWSDWSCERNGSYPFWRIYEETGAAGFVKVCGKTALLQYIQNQDGKKQYLQLFNQAEI